MNRINSISLGREDWYVEATLRTNNRIVGSLYNGDKFIRQFDVALTGDRFAMIGGNDKHGFKIKLTFAYPQVEVDLEILKSIVNGGAISHTALHDIALEDRLDLAKILVESYLRLKKD